MIKVYAESDDVVRFIAKAFKGIINFTVVKSKSEVTYSLSNLRNQDKAFSDLLEEIRTNEIKRLMIVPEDLLESFINSENCDNDGVEIVVLLKSKPDEKPLASINLFGETIALASGGIKFYD